MIGNRLLGSAYAVWGGETRVRAPDRAVVHPDVWIRCGPYDEDATDNGDPVVVVEVLSPGTRHHDLVRNRRLYQSISTVQHIAFVEPKRVEVELVSRQSAVDWSRAMLREVGETLELTAVSVASPLEEIYGSRPQT